MQVDICNEVVVKVETEINVNMSMQLSQQNITMAR